MNIAMSGASGYVGQHLTRFLTEKGHIVVPLGRALFKEDGFNDLCHAIETCQVVINLAGASINKRWTEAYKQELYNSRIPVTRQIVRAIKAIDTPPQLFISTSAVGYYPANGTYDEYHAQAGHDFLARLCVAWEQEAHECPSGVRLVIARFGIILSEDGGALKQMIRPQRLTRVGVIIGNGQQSFPWISMTDLCRAYDYIILHTKLQGVVNLTSPGAIPQKHLAKVLAKAEKIRLLVPMPKLFFRLLYGEGASFMTSGQTVCPAKLQEAGFTYVHPTIEKLLINTTVPTLDIPRYMGHWYEIARYENRFEKEMTHVTATYTLQPDGTILVENEGQKYGKSNKAIGRAKQPDPNDPGKLKVSFFLWFYADYHILELDKEYRYAVVGSNTKKYLWILSRQKTLPDTVRDELLRKLRERGYDTDKLIFTRQD